MKIDINYLINKKIYLNSKEEEEKLMLVLSFYNLKWVGEEDLFSYIATKRTGHAWVYINSLLFMSFSSNCDFYVLDEKIKQIELDFVLNNF